MSLRDSKVLTNADFFLRPDFCFLCLSLFISVIEISLNLLFKCKH